MWKPNNSKTITDYAEDIFSAAIRKEITKFDRVDIIFDTYKKYSLKAATRKKRGKGIRRKVENNSQPPNNRNAFLRIDENKSELFRFLSNAIIKRSFDESKLIICAFDETVTCNQPYNSSFIVPCTQEKLTHEFLYMYKICLDKAFGVVVIAIALFTRLNLKELWIEFGTGNNKVIYPVHLICNNLGSGKCKALLFFHALTGCDQVSYFNICKKKVEWKT